VQNGETVLRSDERRDTYSEKVARGRNNDGFHRRWRVSDPQMATLRAYRSHHPSLRVFLVERNGRTVWLTWKQLQILNYVDSTHHRNKWLTLSQIAEAVRCSISTVSRTLVRFDLWRFVDYLSVVGRYGGIWVKTRMGRYQEADANAAGAKHTLQSRKIARTWLATKMRLREWRKRLELKERPKPPHRWTVTSGSMDGMFP
jgi:hypothetical protein